MEKPTQPSLFGLEDEIGIVRESIQVLFKKVNEDKQDTEVTAKVVGTLSRTAVHLAQLLKAHRNLGLPREDIVSVMNEMTLKLLDKYKTEASVREDPATDEAHG